MTISLTKSAKNGSLAIKTLYIPCAPSGSGKSTLAKKLKEEQPDLVICSADTFFVQPDGSYNFNPGRLKDAHEDCQFKAQVALSKGLSVYVDNTNTVWEHFEIYIRYAAVYGHKIVFKLFDVPKEKLPVLVARNVHSVPEKSIERQWQGIQELKKTLTRHMKSRFEGVEFVIEKIPLN